MTDLVIKSPAFEEGGWIPQEYTGYGEDKSPELWIENLSNDAKSLVITLDDASHPLFKNYNHWIAWNVEVVDKIPEGLPQGEEILEPIYMRQGVGYGKHKYRGPKPPFNWNHTYVFTVYALDQNLTLPNISDKELVVRLMEDHVLQKGTLTGKYQRRHK